MADSSDAIARTPRGQFLSLIDPDQRSLHGTPGVTPRELALAGLKNPAAGGRSGRSGAVTPTGGGSSSTTTTLVNLKAAAMVAKARGAALSPRPGVSPSGRSTPGAGASPQGGGGGTKARAALALEADTSTGPPGGGSDALLAPAQPAQAQQQPGAEQGSSSISSTPTRGVTPNGGRMISPFAAVQPEQQEVHPAARPESAPPRSTSGGSSGMPAAPWLLQGGSKAAAHAQYCSTAGGPGLHVLGSPPGALQQQRQVLHPAELSAADGSTGPRRSDDNGSMAGAPSGGAAGGSGLASLNPAMRLCSSAASSPYHLAFARLGSMATVGSLAPFADMQQQQRTISVADSFACPGTSVDFFVPLGTPAAGGHTSSSGNSNGASLLSRGRGPGGTYRAGSLAEGAMHTSSLSPALKRQGSMAPASTEITEEGSEGAEAPGGGGAEATAAAALPPQQQQVLSTSACTAPCRTADVLEEEEAAAEAAAPETGPTAEGAARDVATSKLEAVAVAVRTAATAVVAVVVPAAVKRAVATKNGRRVCVAAAVLILGGLWALSATLATASTAGAGVAAAAAGTATATESAATAATTGAVVDAAVKTALGVAATTAQAAGAASAAAVAVGVHAARVAAWPAQGPIVSLSTPALTSHLYSHRASAVTVGWVDAALLQQQGAARVTAEGCAAVAGLPVAQMLCA